MMAGFKRAQLNGSEELFRATSQEPGNGTAAGASNDQLLLGHTDQGQGAGSAGESPPSGNGRVSSTDDTAGPEGGSADAKERPVHSAGGVRHPGGRLTPADIDILANLIQGAKFPSNPVQKPPLEEFEQLELLRKKLLSLK